MQVFRRFSKPLAYAVAVGMLSLSLHAPGAHAGLASTESVLTASQAQQDRDRIGTLLAREDVKAQLTAYGVQPDAVQTRVDGLTDQEVHSLAGRLDQLPAGGDGVGSLLFVALVVFLVLLFTDIMGWTSVFPFTKKGSARQ
jgi:hypothetical protein